ncbi:uncharacterized protein RAG0_03286 [Rhynchosporium agropyri]|uniref:Uncharacterized protein n=1 Tax=Rhynchosporium agropyri TaxID=914238 RepID=A0A1E1K825_9HELO|nr:uncharacterized protein RAG0_03286 [Rhynchosporium agropyri]
MSPNILIKIVAAVILLLLPGFYLSSPTSKSAKLLTTMLIAGYAISTRMDTYSILWSGLSVFFGDVYVSIGSILFTLAIRQIQQNRRYARINKLKSKFSFNDDPTSWKNMTVEQAQEIESNMAEWEFPRLFQFAWISDFLRTSTNPGVSRALVRSGHMVNPDPMIEHERLQTTVHLMSAMVAMEFRSATQSLVVSRINEHHHRYGSWINSDDVLYLIIHFSQSPVQWINAFGYRKLEAFEVQAMWVLWREIACSMGVKYIPENLEQANKWRENFESTCRWREDANEEAGMAMMNEIIYVVPSIFKPFARKLIVSILDEDIVHFCQLEKLSPSAVLRSLTYGVFRICSFFIREFCFPRLSPYKRTPDAPNNRDTWNFGHTPYDTLPFFQERSLWNLFGYGALARRLYGIPMASSKYFSAGIAIERMGALQNTAETQTAAEKKVRENAAVLEKAPYGYRPAIGFQVGRLLPLVEGPSYGLEMNSFPKSAPLMPASTERFEKKYERRSVGSKLTVIEKAEDVVVFDNAGVKLSGIREAVLCP